MFSNKSYDHKQSWVVRLLIINALVFLMQILLSQMFHFWLEPLFGLMPYAVTQKWWLWQVVTYMFLHSQNFPLHILLNMYILWIFGLAVEQEWGPRRFVFFYFFTGIGAGLSILALNYFQSPMSNTIGASGAIFGLLLAFGLLYPNAEILLFFILPIKAKYLVVLYGGLEFVLMVSSTSSNVSHIGHLGGLLFGLLYFVFFGREYLFGSRKKTVNQAVELIGEIKKKVDELKEKTSKQSQEKFSSDVEGLKKRIAAQGLKSVSLADKKFLDDLASSISKREQMKICQSMDFSMQDQYCRDCDFYRFCTYRDITGEDPLETKETS